MVDKMLFSYEAFLQNISKSKMTYLRKKKRMLLK